MNHELPIVADDFVNLSLAWRGYTPAHDPKLRDGVRHNLEQIQVIDTATMTEAAGADFAGLIYRPANW